jgi:pyridoxal phosphate enzyme (YggS family)
MPVNQEQYRTILAELELKKVTLVAVSKTKPAANILELYQLGQRDFGENYVQEIVEKQQQLPSDIHWHFIGHLQSNKVKYIAPFVYLIHGVDSLKLLREIDKQGAKAGRVIPVLLQVHIAAEETKFGFDSEEVEALLADNGSSLAGLQHILIRGFMGMASFSDNKEQVQKEFNSLHQLFDLHKKVSTPNVQIGILSMGMSGDYPTAIAEGSNMVRIGSLLFGSRQ